MYVIVYNIKACQRGYKIVSERNVIGISKGIIQFFNRVALNKFLFVKKIKEKKRKKSEKERKER